MQSNKIILIARYLIAISVTIYYSLFIIALMAVTGNGNLFHKYSRKWSKALLKIFGIKLSVEGEENLNHKETYIYVSNHASLFDIPVILAGINDDIRIMYKRELEKIPIFGWGLKRSPFISVNRSMPRNAMESIEEAIVSIKDNVSVLIFPEGTRSKNGAMGDFKRGAFMLASRSGKAIAPLSIIGSRRILANGFFRLQACKVKLIINQPINNFQPTNRSEEKELMHSVKSVIEKSYSEG